MLTESGIRDRRIEWVRETSRGETPADPAWQLFSDRMINFEANAAAQYDDSYAIGDEDPKAIERGPEDHTLTVGWRLQRWFVDGGGAAQDPAGYGLVRNADHALESLSVLDREDRHSGGADANGFRLYTHAVGAVAGTVTITLDPDTGEPIPVSVEFTCEKIRSYRIDQPAAPTTLQVVSSDPADATQTVTIEDDGGATSEDVALNGDTPVTTVATFASIDAVHLDGEAIGDVTISDGAGTIYMVIRGSASYQGIEGDLGVPSLGGGSRGAAIGTTFEKFIDDSITRGGSALAVDIVSGEIRVDNGLDTSPRGGTYRRRIEAGQRQTEMTSTLVGEAQSHDDWEDHLRQVESDIVWTASGGTITLSSATLREAGARAIAPDLVIAQRDNTFRAQGIVVA